MKDVLIVGFGLAGLSVAWHAHECGLQFDIVNDHSQRSSKIAGGILNPVAIKRMKPVWNVESFLPYATEYYKKLEEHIGQNFSFRRGINVYIQDNYKSNLWFEALDNKRVVPFISPKLKETDNPVLNVSHLGKVDAQQIDLPHLFTTAVEHYKQLDSYREHSFDYSSVSVTDESLVYDGNAYKHIIFCEGFGVTKNPFFNNLGVYGNKGDYLIIQAKGLTSEQILKSKFFLIPLGDDTYKFGATYQRKPLDHEPSDKAKAEMREALEKMINCPYKIIDQVCGIRPTTKDRKPVLGTHFKHNNLHVFNGFGSRGVMTSPLLGKQLINHVFNAVPLPKDISINRIYART